MPKSTESKVITDIVGREWEVLKYRPSGYGKQVWAVRPNGSGVRPLYAGSTVEARDRALNLMSDAQVYTHFDPNRFPVRSISGV